MNVTTFLIRKKLPFSLKKGMEATKTVTFHSFFSIILHPYQPLSPAYLFPLAWDDFYNETKNYVLAPLALLFQFQTGIRIGELCVIRYEDLTEQRGYIHIQRMLRRDTSEVVSQHYTQNIAKSWELFRRAPTKP